MESDSYWNEKRKHSNIFNDAPGGTGDPSSTPFALSARQRPSLPRGSLTPAVPVHAISRSHTLPSSATVPSSSSTSYSSTHLPQLTCVHCGEVITPDVCPLYEGRAVFHGTKCLKDFIVGIAGELTQGDSFRMHRLKTVTSKVQLVRSAVDTGIGDAIIRATVFFAAQTSQSVFLKELRYLDVARNHYLSYLRQFGNFEDAADIYDAMGESEKAMMLRLAVSPCSRWTEAQHVNPAPNGKFFSLVNKMVRQQIRLNDLHERMEAECRSKSELEKLGGAHTPAWMQKVPVPPSLKGVPLMSTLLYAILFENNPKGLPNTLEKTKEFDMKDAHFRWLRVEAMNILGEWELLREAVIASKGFSASALFKSLARQPQCFIPPQRVARYLRLNGAWDMSEACLMGILKLVSNVSERYEWALELGVYAEAVNCAAENKNEPWMQYLNKMLAMNPQHREVAVLCQNFLKKPVKTWKPL